MNEQNPFEKTVAEVYTAYEKRLRQKPIPRL